MCHEHILTFKGRFEAKTMILDGFLSICGMRQSFSSKILELKLFSGNETKNFGNETKSFGNETFFRESHGKSWWLDHVKRFSSKILELKLSQWLDLIMSNLSVPKFWNWNFLSGWIWSCRTFQFQNCGTETFSVVGFDHVEPFSSKISELKLSQWLDLIMSNLSVPKFRNWNFLSGWIWSCRTFQFQSFGTETFSMVWLDHVEPFSSKISELKPWGPLKTFYFRNFGTDFFSGKNNWFEFQYSGALRFERQFECL